MVTNLTSFVNIDYIDGKYKWVGHLQWLSMRSWACYHKYYRLFIQRYASSSIISPIYLTTYNNNIKNEDENYSHVVTRVSHESGM